MVTSINEFKKINEENLLIPRRLEDRQLRLKQNNLRLLQKEVIDGDLVVDKSFDLKPDEIRVKQINGDVFLTDIDHIPEWLENVIINGNFDCFGIELTTLKYCPKIVKRNFDCSDNKLTSLEFCPETIARDFSCNDNLLTTLKFCPAIIHGTFNCSRNSLSSLEFCPKIVDKDFFCPRNGMDFTIMDVRNSSQVKGKIHV